MDVLKSNDRNSKERKRPNVRERREQHGHTTPEKVRWFMNVCKSESMRNCMVNIQTRVCI